MKTRILFYRKSFNRRYSFYDRLNLANIQSGLPGDVELIFDTNVELLQTADVVIFDVPFVMKDIISGKIPVFEGQILVGWCMECEENYPWLKNKEIKDFFDIWMTYHTDSDIVVPYYDADYSTRLYGSVPVKKNDVCMFISSMVNSSKRQEYLLELMNYIHIDSFGRLFNNKSLSDDNGYMTKLEIMKDYRFTIAFENAIAEDYVTEKFYEPLLSGSVPIYMGAPNIERFSPSKSSYIDVRDFSSPKELAYAIIDYCNDKDKYDALFEWKHHQVNSVFHNLLEQQTIHPFIRLINMIKSRQ